MSSAKFSPQNASLLAFTGIKYWPIWLAMGFLRLITFLPWSVGKKFGPALGYLLYQLSKRRRGITEKNIATCFPKLDQQQQYNLVLQTFYANGTGVIETAYAWWSSLKPFNKHIQIDGLEALQEACDSEQGVLLLGAHFTSPDLGCALLNQHQPFSVTYQRHKNPLMDALILRGRSHCLGGAIERDQIRQVVKTLKDGQTVWLAPDQDLGPDRSVFAHFFGIPTATTAIASRLAKSTQCRVFFFSHQQRNNQSYHLQLIPLDKLPSGEEAQDAAIINSQIEEAVRQYPAQYLWLHRRFKTRPHGSPEIY
ncbi:MAG: lipid A biosynthesis lauroyl acyltransferase [Pseudomonadales bacterium]